MPSVNGSDALPELGDFKILNVTMPSLSTFKLPLSHFSMHASIASDEIQDLPVNHSLYFRLHETRKSDPELPCGQTLFMINLPVDTTHDHLQRLFRRCGSIQKVIFKNGQSLYEECPDFEPRILSQIHKSGVKAHVVFEDEEACQKALSMKVRKRIWSNQMEDAEDHDQEQPALFGVSSKSLLCAINPLQNGSLNI